MESRGKLIFVVVLFLSALLAVLPSFNKEAFPAWYPFSPIKLGLDLRGGASITYEVDTKEAVKGQITSVATAVKGFLRKEKVGLVRTRVEGFDTLQIVLRGNSGKDKVEQYIIENYNFLTPNGESKEGDNLILNYKVLPVRFKQIETEAVAQAIETMRNRVDQFGVAEPTIQNSGDKMIVVQLPDVSDTSSIKSTIGSVAKLEFRLVADPSAPNLEVGTRSFKSKSGERITLEDEVLMTGASIRTAGVEFGTQNNKPLVSFKLSPEGEVNFAEITEANIGRNLAIVLDDVVQSTPVIKSAITGGAGIIEGDFTIADASKLKIVLKSGALPAPLIFSEERLVGATLGSDSIKNGIIAIGAGAILVIFFMIFYYKKAGVLSILALILNLTLLLAGLSIFKATLTLPGLAGLGLTIGMAVDANVIIYERIREELRKGSLILKAIENGFDRAHWSIIDSNVTTLLSGIILFGFGAGTIKGFAVTLCIGIATTLFSALFVTKLGFEISKMRDKNGNLSI